MKSGDTFWIGMCLGILLGATIAVFLLAGMKNTAEKPPKENIEIYMQKSGSGLIMSAEDVSEGISESLQRISVLEKAQKKTEQALAIHKKHIQAVEQGQDETNQFIFNLFEGFSGNVEDIPTEVPGDSKL